MVVEQLLNFWSEFSLVSTVAISWFALMVSLLGFARIKRQANDTKKMLTALQHDLRVSKNGSMGMGNRIVAMEKTLRNSMASQNRIESQVRTQHSADVPEYSRAVDMLESGLNPAEVAARCGLSRTEVSLMELMRQQYTSSVTLN